MSWTNVKTSIQNSIRQNGAGAITGNLLQGALLTICSEAELGTGPQGKSAYQVWLDEGNVGTVSDFFASLKGEKGDYAALRKTSSGIEWKPQSSPNSDYQLLVTLDELSFHFSDFTAEQIEQLQEPALDAATVALEAAEIANDAASAALTASSKAEQAASHPTYVGADYYVYVWNPTTEAYDKSSVMVKGEGFSISNVYASIAAMEADAGNAQVNHFYLINTGHVEEADNAKLYVFNGTSFDFLVDLSGAIGFTGKTPQLGIGTVQGGISAAVSLSENGTDASGNPKYLLNLTLPKGEKGDKGEKGESPAIQGGTWWIYNNSTGSYENTAISVNSQYVLTKTGIEAVLTGDITSHQHTTDMNEKISSHNSDSDAHNHLFSQFKALAKKDKVDYTTDITNLPLLLTLANVQSVEKQATLSTSDWAEQSNGDYTAIIYDADILESKKVASLMYDKDSRDAYLDADIYWCEYSTGQLTLVGKKQPNNSIKVTYLISI